MSEANAAVLELDLGNTRLKWRVLRGGAMCDQGFLVRRDYQDLSSCLAVLRLGLERLGFKGGLSCVRIASVASALVNQELALWLREELDLTAEFAKVSRECAGVVNGYEDYERLGVDRWLAVLAAQRLAPSGVCVVDCGSAVTLDFVLGDRHLGGYIVPGLRLMNSALFGSTDGVKVEAEGLAGSSALVLGRNTAQAVNLGLPAMVAGFVAESVRRFEREHQVTPCVILTGGDAEVVSGHLDGVFLYRPDLVLDGLALVEFS